MYSSLLTSVYERLRDDPEASAARVAEELGMEEQDAQRIIEHLGLRGLVAGGPPYTVTGARQALATLVAPAEAELARQHLQVAQLRASLEASLDAAQAELNRTSVVAHESVEAVWERLEDLSRTVEFECLSLNPGRAHPPEASAASKPLNQQAMERGVQMRSIYQQSCILDAGTRAFAEWFEALGGQVRTQPTVDRQLIIIDRSVAILEPAEAHAADAVAYEIATPALVQVLSEWFEAMWTHAVPFERAATRSFADIEDPMTKGLVTLLADGATDAQAARSLGVSDRTVRRLMSSLMKELGAESRLQLGIEVARRGWV